MKKSISGFVAISMGIILFALLSYYPVQAAVSSCTFTRDLSVGSVGNDVKCLQQYLNSAGFILAGWGPGSAGHETTYFGTATESAVAKWQTAHGISASGHFDAASRAKFNELNQVITGVPITSIPLGDNNKSLSPLARNIAELRKIISKGLAGLAPDEVFEGDIPLVALPLKGVFYSDATKNDYSNYYSKAGNSLRIARLCITAAQMFLDNGDVALATKWENKSLELMTTSVGVYIDAAIETLQGNTKKTAAVLLTADQLANDLTQAGFPVAAIATVPANFAIDIYLNDSEAIVNDEMDIEKKVGDLIIAKEIDVTDIKGLDTAVKIYGISNGVLEVLKPIVDAAKLTAAMADLSDVSASQETLQHINNMQLLPNDAEKQLGIEVAPLNIGDSWESMLEINFGSQVDADRKEAGEQPYSPQLSMYPSPSTPSPVSVPVTTNNTSSSIQAQINTLQQQLALLLKQVQTQQNNTTITSSTSVPNNQPTAQNTTQSQPSVCIPSWNCGTWSVCANGQQARVCTDLHYCGITTRIPSQTQSCLASNSVQAPTAPSVPAPFSTLTSDFGGVEYGTGTTLRWSSSNTTSCTASGGWNGTKALSGSQDTGPLYSSQTFILTCTGPGGSVSQQTSVSVSSPPSTQAASPSSPTLTLTSSLGWVMYGQGTTLQWSSSNAASCIASGGWSGNEPLSGSKDTGPLYSTETFVLTCTGPGGSVSRNTSVGIKNAPTLAVVDSYAATQGKTFNLSGSNFTPNGGVTLHFGRPDGSFYPDQHAKADSYGKLSFSWPVPADAMPGNSSVSATDDTNGLQTSSIGFKIIAVAQTTGDLTLSVSPTSGPPGTVFTVSGTNFTPNSAIIIRFVKADNNQYPPQQPGADANGNLNFSWNGSAGAASGTVSVWALDNGTGRSSPTVSIQITAQ